MKRGRPKMPIEYHLGLAQRKRENKYHDNPTFNECKEILIQIYEKNGPTAAISFLAKFRVEKLSQLRSESFSDFIRKGKALLGHDT